MTLRIKEERINDKVISIDIEKHSCIYDVKLCTMIDEWRSISDAVYKYTSLNNAIKRFNKLRKEVKQYDPIYQ